MIRGTLLFILLLILLSTSIFSQNFDWVYKNAKYRLIYKFELNETSNDVYVTINIPTHVIDNILLYCKAIGKSPCEEAYPRVYYYNSSDKSQKQITDITYTSTYNGYPSTIKVYFSSLPAGTHYILIYYPYIWTEDFEDNKLGEYIDVEDECFSDGWCVFDAWYEREAVIVGNGVYPTTNKRLRLWAAGYAYLDFRTSGGIVIGKPVFIDIDKGYPLITEFDVEFEVDGAYLGIIYDFLLTDGSKVAISYYHYWVDSEMIERISTAIGSTICNNIYITSGHHRINILQDLHIYCNIPVDRVSKLLYVYAAVHSFDSNSYGTMYLDNLRIYHKYE